MIENACITTDLNHIEINWLKLGKSNCKLTEKCLMIVRVQDYWSGIDHHRIVPCALG